LRDAPLVHLAPRSQILRLLVPPDGAAFLLLFDELGLFVEQVADEFRMVRDVMASREHHGAVGM
jgi:hypothetical protein